MEHDGCTATRCRSVCAVVDVIGEPEGVTRVKECPNMETNIDTVMAEKLHQFKLFDAHSFGVPICDARALHCSALLWRTATFGHTQNISLQNSRRAGSRCYEGEVVREKLTS
jgi:hypothetical protein